MIMNTGKESIEIHTHATNTTLVWIYDIQNRKIRQGVYRGNEDQPDHVIAMDVIVNDSKGSEEKSAYLETAVNMLRVDLNQFLDDLRIAMQPILSREGRND